MPTCRLVVLTSPDPHTTFTIFPFIPREHQHIAVQAEVYTEEWPRRVTLYADDHVLAALDQPPHRAPWTLEPGQHTFRAVVVVRDGSLLHSEPVTVLVEEE